MDTLQKAFYFQWMVVSSYSYLVLFQTKDKRKKERKESKKEERINDTLYSFSYHDAMRDIAVKALMLFSGSPSSPPPSKTQLEYITTTMVFFILSYYLYYLFLTLLYQCLFQYDIPRWYDDIKEHTFATKIVPLLKKEGFALAHAYHLLLFISFSSFTYF